MTQIMTINSNSRISIPESISIKKNLDNTYNLYALMNSEMTVNGKYANHLIGLKSKNLRFKEDFDFSVDLSSETNYKYANNVRGQRLCSFIDSITREVLYNLKFSKQADILCEFEILNKGEGIMNYNVFEGLDKYTVQVNVAGFTKEELSIVLEDGIIFVKTRPHDMMLRDDEECIAKNFEKCKSDCEIYLPNIESVDAELKDGILYLNVPKVSKGIKIEIK